MLYIVVSFVLTMHLSVQGEYNDCSRVDGLLEAAVHIESNFREPIEQNGVLVDGRIDLFRKFTDVCLDKYLRGSPAIHSESEKRDLLNVIKKAYFYTRSYRVVEGYKLFLANTGGDYDLANNYVDLIDEARHQHNVQGDTLLLKSNGEIYSLEGKDAILVVSSPHCKFSDDLMRWARSRKSLSNEVNLIWGTKLPVGVSPERFFLKQENSVFNVFLDVESWTTITLWDTPTIYVIRDGVVVKQSVGFTEKTKQMLSVYLH